MNARALIVMLFALAACRDSQFAGKSGKSEPAGEAPQAPQNQPSEPQKPSEEGEGIAGYLTDPALVSVTATGDKATVKGADGAVNGCASAKVHVWQADRASVAADGSSLELRHAGVADCDDKGAFEAIVDVSADHDMLVVTVAPKDEAPADGVATLPAAQSSGFKMAYAYGPKYDRVVGVDAATAPKRVEKPQRFDEGVAASVKLYTGVSLGTLVGGETYTVTWNGGTSFTATGKSASMNNTNTQTYDAGDPAQGDFNIWGAPLRFDELGNVYDAKQDTLIGRFL